jgi:hypothetical protein
MMSIPLKDISTQFELFKLFSFPTASVNGTFAKLQVEHPYFAINLMQRSHLLLSESDIRQCMGRQELKICPADVAVLNNEVLTCPLSLFLQRGQAKTLCGQRILRSPPPTTLLRHGAVVLFHTQESHRAFFRCRNGTRWEALAVSLEGSGLVDGAAACHITMDGVHLRPVLRAEVRLEGPKTQLFIPQMPNLV